MNFSHDHVANADEPDADLLKRFLAADEARLAGRKDWSSGSVDGLSPDDNSRLSLMLDCLDLLATAGSTDPATVALSDINEHVLATHTATAEVHGETLLSQYAGFEISSLLGSGGFGFVYQGRDPRLHRDVAIKIPRPEVLLDELSRRRFQLEAQAVASLQHPNIVLVHKTLGAPEPAIVYEYCNGGTLTQFAKRLLNESADARLPELLIVDIAIRIAEALAHAHSRGILHRDLKPSNILLCSAEADSGAHGVTVGSGTWIPKLADFGLAKILDENFNLTESAMVMGSVNFMAPEQAAGLGHQAGTFTDIFSFGSVMYWLLVGQAPFQTPSRISTLLRLENQEPTAIRKLRPDVSRDLAAVCQKCLQKIPADRYDSVPSLLNDLRAIRDDRPISIKPAATWRRIWHWYRGHRLQSHVLMATLVVLLAILQLQKSHNRQQHDLIGRLDKANAELNAVVERERAARYKVETQQHDLEHLKYVSDLQAAARMIKLKRLDEAALRLERYTKHPQLDFAAGFLMSRSPLTLSVRTEHDHEVLSSALATSEKWLVTGDKQGALFLRNGADAGVIQELSQFPGEVCGLAFSPDDRWLVACGTGDRITVYDTQTWQRVRELTEHRASVRSVAFTPDGRHLISGAKDGDVFVRETANWIIEQRIQAHDEVQNLCVSADGRFFVTGGSDGHTRVWNAVSGTKVHDFPGHETAVLATAISHDGRYVASGGYDRSLFVWDTDDGSLCGTAETEQVWSLQFCDHDGSLWVGTGHGEISVFERSGPQDISLRYLIKPHSGPVRAFHRLKNSAGQISVADDNNVVVVRTPASPSGSRVSFVGINSSAVHPDGRKIAFGRTDGGIRVTDRQGQQTLAQQAQIFGQNSAVASTEPASTPQVAYQANGDLVAATVRDGVVCVVRNPCEEDAIEQNFAINHRVTGIRLSPDGSRLAVVGEDGQLRFLKTTDGSHVSECQITPVYEVCFGPFGEFAFTGIDDGKVVEIRLADGRVTMLPFVFSAEVYGLDCDPTGRYLACGSADQQVTLWDRKHGQQLANFSLPDGAEWVRFSPDGKILAVATSDIRLFDVRSRQLVTTFGTVPVPTMRYQHLGFSRQGDLLLASYEGPEGYVVTIWDTVTASPR